MSTEQERCNRTGKRGFEHDRLSALIVREERSVATARSAIGQLDARIAETKEARKEAVNAVHRERYLELRVDRGHAEQRAEEAMGALREALRDLEGLHGRMVAEAQGADEALGDRVAQQPVRNMVRSWLGARLSGYGVPTTAASELYAGPLPRADGLAVEPK